MNYLVERYYREKTLWKALRAGIVIKRANLRRPIDPLKTEPPLEIWMLMFGYYTISSYDKKKDTVKLTLPNEEIEETLEFNLAMYNMPNIKKFIHVDFALELENFKNAMIFGNTREAMIILSSFVFRSYEDPLNRDATTGEASRRLRLFLRATLIDIEEATKFNKDSNPKDTGEM